MTPKPPLAPLYPHFIIRLRELAGIACVSDGEWRRFQPETDQASLVR